MNTRIGRSERDEKQIRKKEGKEWKRKEIK